MSLFRTAKPPLEQRAMQVTPWGPWTTTTTSSAGVNVTAESSMQLMAVLGSVTLISDVIATFPIDVYRKTPSGERQEVAKPRWLDQPNPFTDIVELITQTLVSLLLDGNAYWAYGIDRSYVTQSIYVLNPREVTVRDDGSVHADGTPVGPIYTVRGEPYTGKLLHLKGLVRPGHLKGLSPIENARQAIGNGLAAQEFGGRFYSNGAQMSGVIKTPDAVDRDKAKAIGEAFMLDHSGLANAWKPGVLFGGAEWQQISVTPEQAQFLQSRHFSATEIAAQMFLLDPSLLGIEVAGKSLTYANLEQRGIHFVQFSLLRWIVRLERAFSFLLPRPQYLKLNVDGLQRADLLTRYQAAAIALSGASFQTVNEQRVKLDLPRMPGADVLPDKAAAPQVPIVKGADK